MHRLLCAVTGLALLLPGAAAAQERQQQHHQDRHDQKGQDRQHQSRPSHNVQTHRPGARPSTYHRYRASTYHYPRGHSYKRWRTGLVLPSVFLSSPYRWTNWGALGLGPPAQGYVWVRYGPDLLLVNQRTGRIADVIYGAFY
ncbi:MAG TPA: RcnB family protein [Sphingomicrobium sp.]|nr:RcnB family protein [Sphingomicrobium sp.]